MNKRRKDKLKKIIEKLNALKDELLGITDDEIAEYDCIEATTNLLAMPFSKRPQYIKKMQRWQYVIKNLHSAFLGLDTAIDEITEAIER